MSGIGANLKSWVARNRYSAWVQYLGSALAVWVALSLWTLSTVLHRHPFAVFLAAVLFTARFLGFGPAVFCSLVSTACLDFFVLPPYFSFRLGSVADLEELMVFLAISMFAGSMARQKTLAESRAEHTTREMAAIVEYSCDGIYSTRPRHHHQLESRCRASLWLHRRGGGRVAGNATGAAGTPRRGGTQP